MNDPIHCSFCNRKFVPTHGNREYCPDIPCQKAKTQKENNEFTLYFGPMRAGLPRNRKCIEDALGSEQTKKVSLHKMERDGFRLDFFCGCRRDESNNLWYLVGPVAFNVEIENNLQFLNLRKLSNDEIYTLQSTTTSN